MSRKHATQMIGLCSMLLSAPVLAWDNYTSEDAYNCATDPESNCYILDVRTNGEWRWVGHPGMNKLGEGAAIEGKVVNISWEIIRENELIQNPRFLWDVKRVFGRPSRNLELVTMCRSGSRSTAAAIALEEAGYTVHNMKHGFEGDKDTSGYRTLNGWKVDEFKDGKGFPYNDSAIGAYWPFGAFWTR